MSNDVELYKKVPTYNKGEWTYTNFKTIDDFREFVIPLFKEPGKYNFDETSFKFNEQGRFFRKNKYYCSAVENSIDYIKYWETEKEKCRAGTFLCFSFANEPNKSLRNALL